jgi:hypothetical protein
MHLDLPIRVVVSGEGTFTPPTPQAPANFQAILGSGASIAKFTWDAYPEGLPMQFYELEGGDGDNFAYLGMPSGPDTEHAGLEIGFDTTWYFRLRASIGDVTTDWSTIGPVLVRAPE